MTDPIDQAVENFQVQSARLLNEAGQPIHVPDEHANRLAGLQAGLQTVVDSTVREAEAEIARLQGDIATISARSPIDGLSPAELQAANNRRQFVQEDITAGAIGDLAGRLRSLLAQGDKADLFLFARYLPGRLETEGKRPGGPVQQAHIRDLWGLLRLANETLNPAQDEKLRGIRGQIEGHQRRVARARKAVLDAQPQRRRPVRL
jgi:hypothetical protein